MASHSSATHTSTVSPTPNGQTHPSRSFETQYTPSQKSKTPINSIDTSLSGFTCPTSRLRQQHGQPHHQIIKRHHFLPNRISDHRVKQSKGREHPRKTARLFKTSLPFRLLYQQPQQTPHLNTHLCILTCIDHLHLSFFLAP